MAEAQAGGASDEGGSESAGATPREVLETPVAALVQVSAGVRGRRPGWARVRVAGQCFLLCAEPGAGSGVIQSRAPRPAPGALILHPPGFLSRPRPFAGLGR